jgi:succinate dehydrogenase/fumarate reductase iron-sulfur protein
MTEALTVRLFRFDPDVDPQPAYRDYVLPYDDHTTILDLLERVNDRDPFAFHRECRMFKCGICAVNVNGRPSLACKERVHQRAERDLLLIEPLDSYPLIKDLMVDFTPDLHRRNTLRPFPEAAAAGVVAGQATARESQVLRDYTACIRCGMCVEVCEKVVKNSQERVNPLHMLDLARLALDHRDQANRLLEALSEGLEGCTECMQCDQVCPIDLPVFELSIETLRDMLRERGLR